MNFVCGIWSSIGHTVSRFARRGIAIAVVFSAAGCGAIGAQLLTSTIVNVAPELLSSTLGQYGARTEFADALPFVKARDWLGLSILARQKLEKQPDRGEWWQIAGYGHMQSGEMRVARDCFRRVTQLLPEDVAGWNLYAHTLAQTGDSPGAIAALDKALQTDPTSTIAWVLLGDLHAAAGRRVEAAKSYERALDIDRTDIFAWYGVGLMAKRTNDAPALERSIKALQQLYKPFADELARK
jgi:cytochrome c-type biogenesis protein CcmH/NrfG